MGDEKEQTGSDKASGQVKADDKIQLQEGKSSRTGDQGVFLEPVGSQESNPFDNPEQPSTQPSAPEASTSPAEGDKPPSSSSGDEDTSGSG